MKTAEMYVTGYKAKLKKDTSYKGAVDGEFYVEGDVGKWYNGSIKS